MKQAMPIVIGYLFGSIPFAFLLSRGLAGVDLRRTGSGNVGSCERAADERRRRSDPRAVARRGEGRRSPCSSPTGGRPAARRRPLRGLPQSSGTCIPIWLRFRGGKGVATACGVFSVLTPWAVLLSLALFLVTVVDHALTSRWAASRRLWCSARIAYALGASRASVPAAAGAAALIVFRHRVERVTAAGRHGAPHRPAGAPHDARGRTRRRRLGHGARRAPRAPRPSGAPVGTRRARSRGRCGAAGRMRSICPTCTFRRGWCPRRRSTRRSMTRR